MTIRRKVPLKAQLEAALLQLGLEPGNRELDHDPALGLRAYDEKTGRYTPDEHDPCYLIWRPKAQHKEKTFGKKATTAGSDVHLAAKLKRLEKAEKFHREIMEARQRGKKILTKKCKSKIPQRVDPWGNQKRRFRRVK